MFDLAAPYVPYLRHPDPPSVSFVSSAGGQIVGYTGTDPNSDGVKPDDQNSQAIAVKPGSNDYTWDTTNKIWV